MADARPHLVRVPFSHYCRKAEWGLTQAGIPYDALDVPIWGMRNAARANPAGTVPILQVGERLLGDSHDILVWADEHRHPTRPPLYPEAVKLKVAGWEAWAGNAIGPPVRREAYRILHEDPALGKRYGLPWSLRAPLVGRRVLLGVLKHYKARRHEAEDPIAIRAALQRTADRLGDRDFLFGDHPTAADIATAALLEPMTLFAERRGYASQAGWPEVEAFVQRVRPEESALVSRRQVREQDWKRLERLALLRPPPRGDPLEP